jgi:glutathione synthase/RimK-type ligase-like ATP-grasp enzyme
MLTPADCCILNNGFGAWAFEGLARQLASALWVEVSNVPRRYNYLLHVEDYKIEECNQLFIPFQSLQIASDKIVLAFKFQIEGVPTPVTHLVNDEQEIWKLVRTKGIREWCLKYPHGCGASGHRLLVMGMPIPKDWPRPFIVQEFIQLDRPEVYRAYGAGGQVFGWVARRFPEGVKPSPWVAHARGARYETAGKIPCEAEIAARTALRATDLLNSFGCVDLIQRPSGQWVVLEVGTDGMFNFVDRDLGIPELETEIQRRIAQAFWARLGAPPWSPGSWRPRSPEV